MKKQVSSDSLEWSNIDYQVQLATGKSSIKLISAYKYQNSPHSIISSNQLNHQGVDAIVNLTDFGKEYVNKVIQYRIPLEDIIFYAGHVNIHRYHNQPYKIFNFLLCKVNLGLAGNPQTPRLEDCDSVLIQPQIQDEAFQYNFFLKNHKQYQVKYEVTFTVGDDKDFKLSQYQCSNCQNRTPVIYCNTEKLYFCEECAIDHHKTKLMQSHTLQEIDRVNTLQNCKNHNNQKYQFYCLKCEKYLCVACTQKGLHSGNSEHIVKNVKYLYDEIEQNITVLPKKPLEKVESLHCNLSIKRKEIEENYKEIKSQIERDYQRALEILQSEMAKKYQILDSCELELDLLKDKIEWSRSFSQFQKTSLKPIHFFKSESKFENYIKKLKVNDFDGIFQCKPDIVYHGEFRIGQRDLMERIQNSSNKNGQKLSMSNVGDKKNEDGNSRLKLGDVSSANNSLSPELLLAKSILSYDPNAVAPRRGELSIQVENSNLNFFQMKAR